MHPSDGRAPGGPARARVHTPTEASRTTDEDR